MRKSRFQFLILNQKYYEQRIYFTSNAGRTTKNLWFQNGYDVQLTLKKSYIYTNFCELTVMVYCSQKFVFFYDI